MSPAVIAAITAIPDIMAQLQSIWDKYQNGTLTQEEFNAVWNKNAAFFSGAVAGWEAAGQTTAAKEAEN